MKVSGLGLAFMIRLLVTHDTDTRIRLIYRVTIKEIDTFNVVLKRNY